MREQRAEVGQRGECVNADVRGHKDYLGTCVLHVVADFCLAHKVRRRDELAL